MPPTPEPQTNELREGGCQQLSLTPQGVTLSERELLHTASPKQGEAIILDWIQVLINTRKIESM